MENTIIQTRPKNNGWLRSNGLKCEATAVTALATSRRRESYVSDGACHLEGPPPSKRPRQEGASLPSNLPPKISWDIWQKLQPLLIVWPLTICSRLEDRATLVLDANFHVEYFDFTYTFFPTSYLRHDGQINGWSVVCAVVDHTSSPLQLSLQSSSSQFALS
ncbi:hypothetical protein J6590_016063 [Homalodisca vitripennis]|nr:hypothetical protein J6590_016063 [Homalodisca vitripennis]